MFRRSIFELSSRRTVNRLPRQITAQRIPLFLSPRKEFSTASKGHVPPKPGSMGKSPESEGSASKILVGSTFVAGALLVAYQAGYMDQYLGKFQQNQVDSAIRDVGGESTKVGHHLGEEMVPRNVEEPNTSNLTAEHKVETRADLPRPENLIDTLSKTQHHLQDKSDIVEPEKEIPFSSESNVIPPESTTFLEEKGLPQFAKANMDSPNDEGTSSITSSERSLEMGSFKPATSEATPEVGSLKSKIVEEVIVNSQASAVPVETETKSIPSQHLTKEETSEDVVDDGVERSINLLDAYHLEENSSESDNSYLNEDQFPKETEGFASTNEDLSDDNVSSDGKLVLDFLQAIHVAEKRQAELDNHVFAQEKRALKEKYENELRDLRARELMRIEEAAILDKELKRERTKAAATIHSIQEKMEELLRSELEQKETEAELKLTKAQDLAKANLTTAIASEKAAQIEKMAEANLHINALCMAFYARSEEARKSHSVHKLALGALALEDALSKGFPIHKEIDALDTYLEGIKDSNLDLVLSSLPEETRYKGTDTSLQLSQKFNNLKGTLRHFSLIPPGGGGIMAHSVAHIASWLKVKEVDQSGEGIESVIKRVDNYLAEGKLAEAAATLEEGVKGTQAEEIICDWVRGARNRAITEQALTFLQSYATCISLT